MPVSLGLSTLIPVEITISYLRAQASVLWEKDAIIVNAVEHTIHEGSSQQEWAVQNTAGR